MSDGTDAPTATRVLIADDHLGYREGMARLIGDHPELDVVAVAADGDEALGMIVELKPDVALLDVRMPGRTGIDVCRLARDRAPGTRIVLITGTPSPVLSTQAERAGASALLGKETAPDEICACLLAAAGVEG